MQKLKRDDLNQTYLFSLCVCWGGGGGGGGGVGGGGAGLCKGIINWSS